jgi:general secretion pathway protein D
VTRWNATLMVLTRTLSGILLLGADPSFTLAQPSVLIAGQMDLARLIDLAADRLKIAIDYDPAQLKTPVTIRLPNALNDDELWALVNELLASRGMTTVRSPGAIGYSVIRIADAGAAARIEPNLTESRVAGFQAISIRPRTRSVRDVVEAIKPLLSKTTGTVTELGSSGTIIVADLTPRLEQIRRMVAALESEDTMSTRTFSPRRVGVRDAAQFVQQAIARSGGSPRVEVTIEETTGSLIVAGTPAQLDQFAEILARLEAASQAAMPLKSIPIRNRPVSDVVTIVSKLIDSGALESDASTARERLAAAADQTTLRTNSDRTDSSPQVSAGASSFGIGREGSGRGDSVAAVRGRPGSTTNSTNSTSPGLSLTADEATNTLIVMGEPRLIDQLETLLKTLDVRQPQVMLEVMLVSLSETESLSLGVELERLGTFGNSTFRLASLFGLSTGGAGGRTVGDAAGFTGAVLNPGEFSVIVRALETINSGRSYSVPKILVTNNEQATFSSTLQQPFATLNTIGGNQTVQNFGGTQDAGTTISVKPQIAQGDHLLLQYSLSLSSFTGPGSQGLPPPKQQNKVDSIAAIPDGHTIMVGGLEVITGGKGTTQVPILGNIPILGEAFKTRNNSFNRTRFFVFIRAGVLRRENFEDLKYLSQQGAESANVDDGFPVVKTRVIR